MTRLVDLSMPVHQDMLTFPRVPPPPNGLPVVLGTELVTTAITTT